ncbi:MAG: DUF4345 family protein [Kordiimonadaceae bacterium]|nr:DUF4345 family protein [Kordiimonadaceae bacterium]
MTLILLGIIAVFFLYTGLHSLIAPKKFAQMLNLEPIERSGEIEIRAQYGGFFLAAACSQIAGILGYLPAATALMVSFVIFGGLIGGRLIALFWPGSAPISPTIRSLFIVDAIGAVATAYALYG